LTNLQFKRLDAKVSSLCQANSFLRLQKTFDKRAGNLYY